MKFRIKCIISLLLVFRYIPHLISYVIHPIVREDVRFWQKCCGLKSNNLVAFLYFLTYFREYRNVLYKRCYISLIHKLLAPPLPSLYITTDRKNIGKGLFIHHGFATVISAKSIGEFCMVNQQVTIGYTAKGNPIVGNYAKICAGAIVVGPVHVGDNSIVAAGAIVVDDVPENSVVCSPKAKVVKKRQ